MKLSIHSRSFIWRIDKALKRGDEVVIWHQIPWSGGAQDWYLIHSLEELPLIFKHGKPASAFTAYQWLETSLPTLVNQDWEAKTLAILEQEVPNAMLLPQPIEPNSSFPVHLKWIGESEDPTEWAAEHAGSNVRVGRIPNVWTGEIVRGYYPDAHGNVRSGAY